MTMEFVYKAGFISRPSHLIELAAEGKISRKLVENWSRILGGRYRPNPIEAAVDYESEKYRRLKTRGFAATCGWLLVAIAVVSLIGEHTFPWLRIMSNTLFCVAAGLFFCWFLRMNPGESEFVPHARALEFIETYDWFCQSVSEFDQNAADSLKSLPESQLQKLATEILVRSAKAVHLLERENAGVPEEHWGERKKAYTKIVESRYENLCKLGLIQQTKLQAFYREAESQLAS